MAVSPGIAPDAAREAGRHVLPEADEPLVRSAAVAVTAPRTWLHMPAETKKAEPRLSRGWVVTWEGIGHLTAVDLMATEPAVSTGYTATVRRPSSLTE